MVFFFFFFFACHPWYPTKQTKNSCVSTYRLPQWIFIVGAVRERIISLKRKSLCRNVKEKIFYIRCLQKCHSKKKIRIEKVRNNFQKTSAQQTNMICPPKKTQTNMMWNPLFLICKLKILF